MITDLIEKYQFYEIRQRGEILQSSFYVYIVSNGSNLLTLGMSSSMGAGRLGMEMRGYSPSTHNKSFIVGIAENALGDKNKYFIKYVRSKQEAIDIERSLHSSLGIVTNNSPACIIDNLHFASIAEVQNHLFRKFKHSQVYLNLDDKEKSMCLELEDICSFGKLRPPTHQNFKRQGDCLSSSVLSGVNKGYLKNIFQKMTSGYYIYRDLLSVAEMEAIKDQYDYTPYGRTFEIDLRSTPTTQHVPTTDRNISESDFINTTIEFTPEQFEEASQYLLINPIPTSSHRIYIESSNPYLDLEIELPPDNQTKIKKTKKLADIYEELKTKSFIISICSKTNKKQGNQFKTDCLTGSIYVVVKTTPFSSRSSGKPNYFSQIA